MSVVHPAPRMALPLLSLVLAACAAESTATNDPPGGGVTPVATSIVLTPTLDTLLPDGTRTFVAVVRDQQGATMSGAPVSWSIGDTTVARLAAGVVTARAAGSTQLTATSGNATAQATVVVRQPPPPPPAPPASVVVAPGRDTLDVNGTRQLAATVRDANNATMPGVAVTWTTSNANVANVNGSGLVTALAAGTAQVRAATGNVFGEATIVVRQPPPPPPVATTVTLAPARDTLDVNGTRQLAATVRDQNNAVMSGAAVSWATSDAAVATVSGGLVTARAAGTATITATSGSASGTATIVVRQPAPPPAASCANPGQGWIWCDDFEQDRLASYFDYNPVGGGFARASGVGRNGTTGMRSRFTVGQVEAGNIKVAFGRVPSTAIRTVDAGTANYREIYWRMYVRNQAGWVGGAGYKLSRATVLAGSNWQQAMIAHVWGGTQGTAGENHIYIDPASGTNEAGTLITTTYNDFANLRWLGARQAPTPIFAPDRVGRWYCVEARVRLNDAGQSNGVFQLWIDGNLEAGRTDINYLGAYSAYGLNGVFFENYWNTGSPAVQERYFDDIVVSTQRIGC